MRIIGLTGPAGSGKSTVASILVDRHAYHELSFGDPLRRFVRQLLGISSEQLQDIKEQPQDALCGRSPRELMQLLGTEFGRELIGEDLWVRRVEREANWLIEMRECRVITRMVGAVVSDVRFANEADWVRSRGELWHLSRPGHQVQAHISEDGLSVAAHDRTLDNDCDLPTLHQRVAQLLGAD
jgi:hypothetical protein